jgi:hypothetical protein
VRRADAIEVVIGQGAKPGGGGMLLGQKVNPRVAKMRTLPEGVDQRSACRHPDWTGPDDLAIKIQELREITDWEKPIYVKVGATRTFNDVKLAVHSGADVVVVDGMQGGTAATQTCFIEHIGIPTLAAVRQAVDALEDLNMKGKVQLIVSGGIRTGADVAKALAMGADAVAIGQGILYALGCNSRDLHPERRAPRRQSRLRRARHGAGLLPPLPHRQVPGRHHHAGRHPGTAPAAGRRRPSRQELPEDAEHGTDHHRPRLRQAERASPGTRGPGRADARSRRHGAYARWPAPTGFRATTDSDDDAVDDCPAGIDRCDRFHCSARSRERGGVRCVQFRPPTVVITARSQSRAGIRRCRPCPGVLPRPS